MSTSVEHARVSGRTAAQPVGFGMTHEIVFGGDPEDVLVRTAGTATVDGLSAMGSATVTDPRFRPPLKLLVDHRLLDWRQMTADDVRLRAERLLDREAHLLVGCRLAIVPHGTAGFGVVRMLWGQVEADVRLDFGVFATIEEARAWLADARV